MEKKYKNLTVKFSGKVENNTMLYVKEDAGVFMAKTDAPITVFTISERNMIGDFWDFMKNNMVSALVISLFREFLKHVLYGFVFCFYGSRLTLCRFHKRTSLVRGIFFNAPHRLWI